MATEIVMPRLSDSMEEGTVVRWLKAVGEEVAVGETLVEIETDKATMTYEADVAGVLLAPLAPEGETLPIGAVIAHVGEAGEAEAPADAPPEPPRPGPDALPAIPRPPSGRSPTHVVGGRPPAGASPLARRTAADRGIDLADLSGSGPGGRIVKADVEAAAATAVDAPAAHGVPSQATAAQALPGSASPPPAARSSAKGEVTVEEPNAIGRAVARRMAESRATVPDFSVTVAVDMGAVLALRARLREIEAGDAPPSVNDFVVKACARALREQPRANASWRDDRIELYGRVNVGIAVAAEGALVVPTVFDADVKGLGQIAREARALAEAVRAGTVAPGQLDGGTFTVSNLGMYGVDSFEAVINPPQAAILAVGAVAKRPVVDDHGAVVAADIANLTLVCDHRVLYGADGARLLARVRELLETPLGLAL